MFYVFAGNNGSGKSTIRNLIIDKIGVEINLILIPSHEELIQKTMSLKG
jgi:predicted ABC-type ATPase